MFKPLLLLLYLGCFFAGDVAWSATCGEGCSSTSDCDSTCPICIGTCVSCYELGNATACLSADTGGSTNCQWDGQNCKSLTDVPTMPSRLWYLLLVPLLLAVVGIWKRRGAR